MNMSEDEKVKCPLCGGDVRMYGVRDYELKKSGEIHSGLHGWCDVCDMKFSIS